ncbi:fimbrial protein [Citrobacter farmeri]|uniref:fimbrial protein n=1 Tax=Citrobacter amalonaticus TaxID=35703 RepID=UPI00069BE1D8|nr:fimbrial protein [Citrobacter amalonaticus]EKV5654381.1 type 1 fimbrial protein [Citrobacter farmeri]
MTNSSSENELELFGKVNLEGSIISSACDIDTGDGYQSIAMPTETRRHIKRTGEGEPQDFYIRLTNCSLGPSDNSTAWQYINIIFDGDEDDGMFRVNGNASGVALVLVDRNGTEIHPGQAMPWQQSSVTDNRLDYRIKLKNNLRGLVVGDYSATIRYRVEYF